MRKRELSSVPPEELTTEKLQSRARNRAIERVKDKLNQPTDVSRLMTVDVEPREGSASEHRLELSTSGDGVGITEYALDTGEAVEEWWFSWSELSAELTGKHIPPDIV